MLATTGNGSTPAPPIVRSVHGVLLACYGLGVLLIGASGCGKSRLAWQLLQRGHALICDDAPLLSRDAQGRLWGHCDPLLRGVLHVRGLGALDIPTLLGSWAVREQQRLDWVLRLISAESAPQSADQVALEPTRYICQLNGVALPELRLAANTAALADNAEALLRTELQYAVLQHDGHPRPQLQQRLQRALRGQVEADSCV
jgi:serine kinase of HPr protein (carbohydrate metabolism regulator)